MKSKLLLFLGLSLIGIMVVLGVFAPLLTSYDPQAMNLTQALESPSPQHWFGLDENGSDVFSQVVFGARTSLIVAFVVTFISTLFGLLIGSLAGWRGGWVDTLIMRVIDIFYGFPNFLLALALVAFLGPSLKNLILAFCITGWTSYARLIRGEVLHLKERDFVQSALALGTSHVRVVVRQIWPNLVGPFTVQASFAMAAVIIAESSLSFLGLGIPPTTPTWGALLQSGRKVMLEAPHISLFPGLAILTLVLGFNLFGDGLRDYLDPKKT